MKVFYFPDYTENNPYQNLLYSEFAGADVSPGNIDLALEAIEESEPSESTVFHLHWQHVITSPSGSSHEHRLLAAEFLQKLKKFQICGGKVVWTIHNKLPHDTKFYSAELEFHCALSNIADLIILHDKSAIEIVNEEYTVDPQKVKLIPHGNYLTSYQNDISREEARKRLGLNKQDIIFGFVGQLRPYKGLSEFIDSVIPVTKEKGVSALIAGKPVWPFNHGKVSNQCAPFSKVKVFEGFIHDNDLQLYLNSSDVIVLPYKNILTSGSVLLAASFGRVVVLPDIKAFENIRNEEFVFPYPVEEVGALERTLNELVLLGSEELKRLGREAIKYAQSLDWGPISRLLYKEVESISNTCLIEYNAQYENKSHTVQIVQNDQDNNECDIAICVVNYRSFLQLKTLSESLKKYAKASYKLFILDNSECEREFSRICRDFNDAVIVRPTENLGYAGGNNVLIDICRNHKIKNLAILNPDIILKEDVISKMLLAMEHNDNAIFSPIIVRENGLVTFHSATISDDSGLVNIEHHYDGKDIRALPSGSVETDCLNGCALFFSLNIVEKYGFIPEEYFLYFEETDWTWSIKKAGGELVVIPDTQIIHTKGSQKGGLPTLPYTYYLLRSALLFANKHGFDSSLTRSKYHSSFVKPWAIKIKQRAPEFEHCFMALCRMALEHGMSGIHGPIEIFKHLPEFADNDYESMGFLEGASSREIRGWAIADRADPTKATQVLYFGDNVYLGSAKPATFRADIETLGCRPVAGFKIDVEDNVFEQEINALDFRTLKSLEKTNEYINSTKNLANSLEELKFSTPKFLGRIDGIKNGRVRGWVYDSNNPTFELEIEIFIDGIKATACFANIMRADLKKAGIADGRRSFEAVIAPVFLDKEDINLQVKVLGSPVTLIERKVSVEPSKCGYDHHTNFQKFLSWSFTNVAVPFGEFEKSLKLKREMDFIKSTLVDTAQLNLGKDDLMISIIMPAFNRADVIDIAINSVLSQSYDNFELIVIDDGSTDRTCDVVENFISNNPDKKIKLIRSIKNGGVSVARNKGLREANGEIIAYLDSDNEWDEEYLLLLNQAFKTSKTAYTAYAGQEIWYSDASNNQKFRTSIRMLPFNRSLLENSNFIDLNVFSHKKTCLEEFGYFREELRRLVDWDLILRYTKKQSPIMIPALMNKYFFGLADNQITSVEGYKENLEKLIKGVMQ